MIALREVPFAMVQGYASDAVKEHVKILDYGLQMRWFLILDGRATAGCLGLLQVGDVTHIKGVYVVPTMRGRGIGTRATEEAIAMTKGTIEAAAINPSWYHARGFRTIGRSESGFEVVRREWTS